MNDAFDTPELRRQFRTLDRVPAPDLWSEIAVRAVPAGAAPHASLALVPLFILLLATSIGAAILVGSGLLTWPTPRPSPPAEESPRAGTWAETAPMAGFRAEASAVLLPDGTVLVLGGQTAEIDADGNRHVVAGLRAVERYDPQADEWVSAGTIPAGVAAGRPTATLLRDGSVLVVGGAAQVFDPTTRAWRSTDGPDLPDRCHTATRLADGRVLVAGGSVAFEGLASAWLYDPVSGAWTAAPEMSESRCWSTATLLEDGRVLVIGGASGTRDLASAEIYDPVRDSWTSVAPVPQPAIGHSATLLLDGSVLVAGGWHSGNGTLEAEAFRYSVETDTWERVEDLPGPRGGHSATLLDGGHVLVAGGHGQGMSCAISILDAASLFDPTSATWHDAGAMREARYNHATVRLPNGNILVVGGKTTGCDQSESRSTEVYAVGDE